MHVHCVTGHLGKFVLSVDWQNFGNELIKVSIEDVYLLVVPSSDTSYDATIQQQRATATKLERLRLAELFHWPFEVDYQQPCREAQSLHKTHPA
jgi:vacuolar protein sorting-associated protein 13A/C